MEGRRIRPGAVAPTCEVAVDVPEESDEKGRTRTLAEPMQSLVEATAMEG
jgi:hypothetical protein